ncbi:MAG: tartrate dehydrogenase/decarboxylase / D-malate dehydrogenase [bacterium]|nr:tartrate dehydrogenase/decarboxylase / D-malate dehydrogenase [bacterium]
MYKVAVIPGDGIGEEVIKEGVKVLDAAARKYGFSIEWVWYPWGADHYLKTGELLPDSAIEEMKEMDAIYLGAVGDPRVPPGILEKEILLKLRFELDLYVNLRPIKLLPGVPTPLKDKGPEHINFYVVRENTEDFYVGLGDRWKGSRRETSFDLKRNLYRAKIDVSVNIEPDDEYAFQIGVNSRKGCERIIRYAFELAKKKGLNKVTAVDKANVLTNVYSLWRDVFEKVGSEYPDIEKEYAFVDAITMWMVKTPENYRVIVTPNMFGDIITDLGAMIQGGLGLAAGGNINPGNVSMFEPIHGSAPKYKGTGKANPLATIMAGAMLLEHIGEDEAAKAVETAVGKALVEGRIKTYDLGGETKTWEVGDILVKMIEEG